MNKLRQISKATDKDAEYVLRRITAAEQHDKNAEQHDEGAESEREKASTARLEAGERLKEVRARVSQDKKMSGDTHNAPGWLAWLRANGIAEATARALMRDAGFTEDERTEHRKKDATRKRVEREVKPDNDKKARLRLVRHDDKHEPVEPDPDFVEDEENYRTAFWLRVDAAIRFATYKRGPVDGKMAARARACAAAWEALALKLEKMYEAQA